MKKYVDYSVNFILCLNLEVGDCSLHTRNDSDFHSRNKKGVKVKFRMSSSEKRICQREIKMLFQRFILLKKIQ